MNWVIETWTAVLELYIPSRTKVAWRLQSKNSWILKTGEAQDGLLNIYLCSDQPKAFIKNKHKNVKCNHWKCRKGRRLVHQHYSASYKWLQWQHSMDSYPIKKCISSNLAQKSRSKWMLTIMAHCNASERKINSNGIDFPLRRLINNLDIKICLEALPFVLSEQNYRIETSVKSEHSQMFIISQYDITKFCSVQVYVLDRTSKKCTFSVHILSEFFKKQWSFFSEVYVRSANWVHAGLGKFNHPFKLRPALQIWPIGNTVQPI